MTTPANRPHNAKTGPSPRRPARATRNRQRAGKPSSTARTARGQGTKTSDGPPQQPLTWTRVQGKQNRKSASSPPIPQTGHLALATRTSRFGHGSVTVTVAGETTSTPGPKLAIRLKCATLKVSKCVTACTWQTASRRASWTCLPITPSDPTVGQSYRPSLLRAESGRETPQFCAASSRPRSHSSRGSR